MKEKLLKRANSYATSCNEEALLSNEIRAKSPVLFVVLGQQSKFGIDTMQKNMSRNVMNAEGVMYLYIELQDSNKEISKGIDKEINKKIDKEINKGIDQQIDKEIDKENSKKINKGLIQGINQAPKEAITEDFSQGLGKENVISLSLPLSCFEREKSRGELPELLLNSDEALKLLNCKLLEARTSILNKGKIFQQWEQIHICFITEGREPVNVLLPDVAVLLRRKLEQDFKQLNMDLFVLLEEASATATPLHQAMTMSFFKELEYYQSESYHYEKATELLDDTLKMQVTYDRSLFQTVFILSDKKENGQKIEKAMEGHFETIATVSLLKNKQQKQMELVEAREQYNNSVFINNISYNGEPRYCTASLAKVRKPGTGIYLSAGYHLFRAYEKELKGEGLRDFTLFLEAVGLSENKLNGLVEANIMQAEGLDEIHSVISQSATFKELKNNTFKEAEEFLYKRSLEGFFQDNFVKTSERRLEENLKPERIKKQIYQEVICNAKYGPYALGELFRQEAIEEIEKLRQRYVYESKQLIEALEEKQNGLVGERIGSKLGFLDKKYLREVKEYLIKQIYSLKYQWLSKQLKLKAIDYIKDCLEMLHEEIKQEIKKLEELERLLKGLVEESNKFEEEYLVQNVNEYYEKIVQLKLEQLEKTRGEHFLQTDKFMGPVTTTFKESKEHLLEKLFDLQEKYFLQDEKLFSLSFEEELLARANMLINYEEKEVAAKSDLYNMLYLSLEENSKPCVFLDTTTLDHRYEEKYFFGDRTSEFMAYAYERDNSTRNYKLAYMNDARKNGIEKLQLMGGFKLTDLVFTKAAKRYYEAYVNEGYNFHTKEIQRQCKV